jgi:hypothetical protein
MDGVFMLALVCLVTVASVAFGVLIAWLLVVRVTARILRRPAVTRR